MQHQQTPLYVARKIVSHILVRMLDQNELVVACFFSQQVM